jgi:chromosome segregation ATPase
VKNADAEIADLRAQLAAATLHPDTLAAVLVSAKAEASDTAAMVQSLKLHIAKLQRELYDQRSERKERLLDPAELKLEELAATATEDELAAEAATGKTTSVKAITRRKPSRKPFLGHLPREWSTAQEKLALAAQQAGIADA